MEFDPDAKFGYSILIGDEIPAYVTIEELQELLKEKAYQTSWDDYILGLKGEDYDVRTSTPKEFWLYPMWVSSHLLVQTCMQDPDAYDWSKITELYNISRIAEILYIWVHPYVWKPQTERPIYDSIILGKVATMQFDAGNAGFPAHQWLTKMLHQRVLFFADHQPSAINDMELKSEGNVLKGMLLWNMMVTDARQYLSTYLEENTNGNHEQIEYFKPETFRENLQYIAEERSPLIAAEILRNLRKDWSSIVAWKCFGIDTLTPEQIEAFRACLFEGMDYYLKQWEAEQPKQPRPKKEPRPTPKSITFKMGNITDGHLQMLRLKLIEAGWIANDTQPDDFAKLFSGKLNSTQITWTSNVGKGMLLFLFNKMAEQGLIVVPTNHSLTTILEKHFIDSDGNNLSGLNKSKESTKHLPIVKECLDILQLEVDID